MRGRREAVKDQGREARMAAAGVRVGAEGGAHMLGVGVAGVVGRREGKRFRRRRDD